VDIRRFAPSWLKSIGRSGAAMIGATPLTAPLLKRAALMPIHLKSEKVSQAIAAIASRSALRDGLVETNGGIGDALRIRVPGHKYELVYGRPDYHIAERAAFDLLAVLIPRSKSFVDVGCNEGVYAFMAAKSLGAGRHGDLHVFEPDPILFARLSDNFHRNGVAARLNSTAVGAKNERAHFYADLDDDRLGSMNVEFALEHSKSVHEVEVIRLETYFAANSITGACVKVDAEGFGVAVWEGMQPACAKVDWMFAEIVGPEWDAGLPARIISESGWYAYYMRGYELRPWTHGLYDYMSGCHNWLFCPSTPAKLRDVLAGSPFTVTH
jgi:FkbM family methyltransferase